MKTNSSLYAVATVGAPKGTKDGKGNQLAERIASRTGEGYAIMDVAGPDRKWTIRMVVTDGVLDTPSSFEVYKINCGWREADQLSMDSWEKVANGQISA